MRWLQSTMRGALFGEQFQHGLAWGNPGADPDINAADALAFAEVVATQFQLAFFNGYSGAFPPDVVYIEGGVVQLNLDDAGGDPSQSFDTQWFPYPVGTRPTGAATSVCLPYEVSCCITLQTDHRGASGRGRFYLPPFGAMAITTHGLFNMSVVGPLATAIGAWIDAVKDETSYVPLVVSKTKKILNEVTSLNVGSVPDSQRRRRNNLVEARSAAWTAS